MTPSAMLLAPSAKVSSLLDSITRTSAFTTAVLACVTNSWFKRLQSPDYDYMSYAS